MSTMNRRAVLVTPREPLQLEEKPVPDTPKTGVVLKTHFCGICHLDKDMWQGELILDEGITVPTVDPRTLPFVLGHEISGEIVSIGSEVTGDLKVGDRVSVFPWAGCKACGACQGGNQNKCGVGEMFLQGGGVVEGGYQQYVAVPRAEDVVKVPDNVPMDVAALCTCPGLTAYNAIMTVKPVLDKFIKFDGKASLLVIGAGGVGQLAIQIAKVLFPKGLSIVIAGTSERQVSRGKEAGADDTIVWPMSATPPEIEESGKKVAPQGFHASVDFVNNSMTIGWAFQVLVKGGIMAQVGSYGGNAQAVLSTVLAVRAISIVGVYTGSYQQQVEVLNLISKHKIKYPTIFRVKLDEASEYLQRLKDGKVRGKAMIDFTSSSTTYL